MLTKTIDGIKISYEKSTRNDKKFMTTTPDGKTVHFGAKGYQDFTEHKDPERRKAYRKRHEGIKLKDGTRAIDKKFSPAWLSYNILW